MLSHITQSWTVSLGDTYYSSGESRYAVPELIRDKEISDTLFLPVLDELDEYEETIY